MSDFIDRLFDVKEFIVVIATFMSGIAIYILKKHIDSKAILVAVAVPLFLSALAANVILEGLGVFFTTDKEANIVAYCGMGLCVGVLAMLVLVRLWQAVNDARFKRHDILSDQQ